MHYGIFKLPKRILYMRHILTAASESEPLLTGLHHNLTLINQILLRLRILWIYIPDSFIFQVKVLSMTLWPNFASHIYNPKVLILHFLMKFMITIMYCSSASPGRGDVGSMMWWYWYCIVRNMHDHCCWWWWYGVVVVLWCSWWLWWLGLNLILVLHCIQCAWSW